MAAAAAASNSAARLIASEPDIPSGVIALTSSNASALAASQPGPRPPTRASVLTGGIAGAGVCGANAQNHYGAACEDELFCKHYVSPWFPSFDE